MRNLTIDYGKIISYWYIGFQKFVHKFPEVLFIFVSISFVYIGFQFCIYWFPEVLFKLVSKDTDDHEYKGDYCQCESAATDVDAIKVRVHVVGKGRLYGCIDHTNPKHEWSTYHMHYLYTGLLQREKYNITMCFTWYSKGSCLINSPRLQFHRKKTGHKTNSGLFLALQLVNL